MSFLNVSNISASAAGVDLAGTRMMPSLMVLDLAQNVFEDVAARLIDALSEVIPGLGENIDIYV